MKAIVINQTGRLPEIEEKDLPVLNKNEVLIKIHNAALNHRDVWIQKGKYAKIKLPLIPGSDGSGIIVKCGADTNSSLLNKEVIINPSFNWGDNPSCQSPEYKILGMPDNGTFAEYISIPAKYTYPKPVHLNFAEAAALPLAGLTAYRALFTRANLLKNEKVLITGIGGGVALFALQFAVAAGAKVYVTSGSDLKIKKAISLGAINGVNYKSPDWSKTLKDLALEFNVIIDGASGNGFPQLIKLASSGGRIVIYGQTTGKIPELEPAKIFWKQLSILGSTMGSDQDFESMLNFTTQHKIKPVIDNVYSIDQTAKAFQKMNEGKQFGKLVLSL